MPEREIQLRVLGYNHPLLELPGTTPENLKAMGVRADPAERVLRRLVDKRGLRVPDAVTRMINCTHPGDNEWDEVFGGGSIWVCLYCGFSLHLPLDDTKYISTDHEDWPDKVRAIARELYPDLVIEGGEMQ